MGKKSGFHPGQVCFQFLIHTVDMLTPLVMRRHLLTQSAKDCCASHRSKQQGQRG
jgi:hypothetical protein